MSTDDYVSAAGALEVELDRIYLTKGNAFHVSLRFDDGSYLDLDLAPESRAHHRILEVLTRLATQTLSGLGESGVVIVGTTAADEDEDGESS